MLDLFGTILGWASPKIFESQEQFTSAPRKDAFTCYAQENAKGFAEKQNTSIFKYKSLFEIEILISSGILEVMFILVVG